MIVILYFDKGYYKWSGPFLKSLLVHEPEAKVVIFGFNLLPKQLKHLENTENVIEIIHTPEEIDFWNLVCQKCWFVLETMRKYPGEDLYIVMDVDTLVINPLDELKRDMANHDIGLVVVSKTKVPSGFLVFKETAISLLNNYHNKVYIKGDIRVKKIEQKILAKLYREDKKLKFLILSRKYIDNIFELDSFLWSAHKLNFGVKDTRLKLFAYVSRSMEAETTEDWKRYLRNWKVKMEVIMEKKAALVTERKKNIKRLRIRRKTQGGK